MMRTGFNQGQPLGCEPLTFDALQGKLLGLRRSRHELSPRLPRR